MVAKATGNTREVDLATRIALRTAPAWRPSVGDILIGNLAGVRVGVPQDVSWDKNGTPEDHKYPVLILDKFGADGKPTGEYVALHAFHTLVRDPVLELLKSKVLAIGKPCTIAYLGLKNVDVEGKNRYHHYYVEAGDGTAQTVTDDDSLADAFGF